jgi:MarR family transcriptional regulator for hemolysin
MENVLDDLRGHILQNVDKADLEAAIRVLQAFDNSEMPQPGTLEKQVEAAS